MEVFEYCDAREAFMFSATRLDMTRLDSERGRATNTYTVWLGGALRGESITRPNAFLDTEYVRRIALDIKGALMTWSSRPNAVARGEDPVAAVEFVMKHWSGWDSSLEGQWP